MNRLLIAALVVLLSSTANAGGNPNARVYIDFDPPNYVHSIPAPEQFTMLEGYLCVDNLEMGITTISFQFSDLMQEYPGFATAPSFTDMFSDELPIWNPFEMGYTASNSNCQVGVSGRIVIGRFSLFYIGQPSVGGCLKILDHGEYPRWLGDCADEIDYFCILAHGSVGGASCPDGDCDQVPVEPGTWGLVKALYR